MDEDGRFWWGHVTAAENKVTWEDRMGSLRRYLRIETLFTPSRTSR